MCHMHGCNTTGQQGSIPVRVDAPEDDSTKSNGEVRILGCREGDVQVLSQPIVDAQPIEPQ